MKCCDLTDKVAIITGASRGIGEAIATQLSQCGANIIIASRNIKGLKLVKDSINAQGGVVDAIQCDVSSLSSFSELTANIIGKFGQIDILVNNAGITHDNVIMRMKEEDWDNVLNINLNAHNWLRPRFCYGFRKF